nr:hypothetical protein [Gemmatimonadales bacterium]
MRRLSVSIATALVTAVAAPRLAAQTTHRITLSHAAGSSEYQVRPDRVTARAGDVLVFRGSGGDHSIIFEDGIPAAARASLAAAMPRRVGALAGPMFGADTEYR